jgi:hypothetical protein
LLKVLQDSSGLEAVASVEAEKMAAKVGKKALTKLSAEFEMPGIPRR